MESQELKLIKRTAITALVVVAASSPRYYLSVFVLAAIPLIFWYLYSCYVAIRFKARRKCQLIRMLIWFFAIIFVSGIHYIHFRKTQINAQYVSNVIEGYRFNHGNYPPDIEATGLTKEKLRELLGVAGYNYQNGEPMLFYGSPITIFDKYFYNFKESKWDYVPD